MPTFPQAEAFKASSAHPTKLILTQWIKAASTNISAPLTKLIMWERLNVASKLETLNTAERQPPGNGLIQALRNICKPATLPSPNRKSSTTPMPKIKTLNSTFASEKPSKYGATTVGLGKAWMRTMGLMSPQPNGSRSSTGCDREGGQGVFSLLCLHCLTIGSWIGLMSSLSLLVSLTLSSFHYLYLSLSLSHSFFQWNMIAPLLSKYLVTAVSFSAHVYPHKQITSFLICLYCACNVNQIYIGDHFPWFTLRSISLSLSLFFFSF